MIFQCLYNIRISIDFLTLNFGFYYNLFSFHVKLHCYASKQRKWYIFINCWKTIIMLLQYNINYYKVTQKRFWVKFSLSVHFEIWKCVVSLFTLLIIEEIDFRSTGTLSIVMWYVVTTATSRQYCCFFYSNRYLLVNRCSTYII